MDKLDTCMICNKTFKEGDNTVTVRDAKYLGFYHDPDIATHEPLEEPERAVYCLSCYRKEEESWDILKSF